MLSRSSQRTMMRSRLRAAPAPAASVRRAPLRCVAAQPASAPASPLVTPLSVGRMQLAHRIVLPALTRLRMEPGSEKPRDLNALYYEQRTSRGGLLVSEGIHIDSVTARGFVRAPVLERQDQIDAWAKVVERVHAKGGYFFAQLFHTGRVSHNSLNSSGRIIAPSPLRMQGQLYVEGGAKEHFSMPQEMTKEDIEMVIKGFARASKQAVEGAGFDGIELHGGNGYLLQEFMSAETNKRTDEYGGNVEGRARFLLELVDACVAQVGADRLAVKLNPGCTFSELIEPEDEVREMLAYLLPQLESRGVVYLCVQDANTEPSYQMLGLDKPHLSFDLHHEARRHFKGTYMAAGGLTIEAAEQYVQDGIADLVAFGSAFISTPNVPALVAAGKRTKDLNMAGSDPHLWYSANPEDDARAYVDFPDVPV